MWSEIKKRIITINLRVNRWKVELIFLGIMLIPIWFFILWLSQTTSINADEELVKKTLVGIVGGVLGIAIWVLGSSVIIINLLRDILQEIRKGKKGD